MLISDGAGELTKTKFHRQILTRGCKHEVEVRGEHHFNGINSHSKLVQDGVGEWCPDTHLACTPVRVMRLVVCKTIVVVVSRVRTNDGQFCCVFYVCTQLHVRWCTTLY